MPEKNVDPFSIDINGRLDRYLAFQDYKAHKLATKKLTEAFNNANITLTEENIKRLISKYACDDYADKAHYGEAFAEALSDNKPNVITQYLQKLVRGW